MAKDMIKEKEKELLELKEYRERNQRFTSCY